MNKIIYFIICALLFCMGVTTPHAATQTLSACTEAAFDTAYAAASSGDTIAFPSGSCDISWSSQLTIAKTNLTISGEGSSTSKFSGSQIFLVQNETANGLRIENIGFEGGSSAYGYIDTNIESSGDVAIDGLVVYNCSFSMTGQQKVLLAQAHVYGVFSNCTFTGGYPFYLLGSWSDDELGPSRPLTMGSDRGDDTLVIEDSSFSVNNSNYGGAHIVVTNDGFSWTIRYCTFDTSGYSASWHDFIDTHGTYFTPDRRGTFVFEFYENELTTNASPGHWTDLEGGQGVMYNNRSSSASLQITVDEPADAYPSQDQIMYSGFWGNKHNCAGDMTDCSGGSSTGVGSDSSAVQLNRDYATTQAGFETLLGSSYTPYTYPHPLRGEGTETPANAIQGVSITP